MDPLHLGETAPGKFSLTLDAGFDAVVDATITTLKHEPNGYFWDGVAKTLVRLHAPQLEGHLKYDSEAGMFCARSSDRAALEKLHDLMKPAVASAEGLRAVMDGADADDFDD